jgi:hypothetical protein
MEVVIRVSCDDRGFRAEVEAGGELLGGGQAGASPKSRSWRWKAAPAPDELFKEPNLALICRRLGGPNWRQLAWRVIDQDGARRCEFRTPIKAPLTTRPVA